MKCLTMLLLVLAGCDSGTVKTTDGGYMRVYGEKVPPPPPPEPYYDPRPDLPYNEHGYKTYIWDESYNRKRR